MYVLAEAPSHGLPVLAYDEKSKGSLAYLALAGELTRKKQEKESNRLIAVIPMSF